MAKQWKDIVADVTHVGEHHDNTIRVGNAPFSYKEGLTLTTLHGEEENFQEFLDHANLMMGWNLTKGHVYINITTRRVGTHVSQIMDLHTLVDYVQYRGMHILELSRTVRENGSNSWSIFRVVVPIAGANINPTNSTYGANGCLFVNNTTGKLWMCKDDSAVKVLTKNHWVEVNKDIDPSTLTINANNITENDNRKFVTLDEKNQITTNKTEITNIENRLDNAELTDEKVKLNANDTSSYLADKLDDATVKVGTNNRVEAVSLKGLNVDINTLNYLNGTTGNIQQQLNELSKITGFHSVVNTKNELPTTPIVNGSIIIVTTDSDHDNKTTYYISNGTTMDYVGEFGAGDHGRNFTTDPLKLDTETTNILPKSKYEKQDAHDTPFSHTGIAATNTEDAIVEIKDLVDTHSTKKASATELGHVMVDNDSISIDSNGKIYTDAHSKSFYYTINPDDTSLIDGYSIDFDESSATISRNSDITYSHGTFSIVNNTEKTKHFRCSFGARVVIDGNTYVNFYRDGTRIGQQTNFSARNVNVHQGGGGYIDNVIAVSSGSSTRLELRSSSTNASGSQHPYIPSKEGSVCIVEL